MVYINKQAKIDLDNIVIGLLDWEKVVLTVEEVWQYVDNIAEICYGLDKSIYHFTAKYETHKRHGKYCYPYRRNARTTWYIIYNKTGEDIYIEKIISNYMTVS